MYQVIDEQGKLLHNMFPRDAALMWAARWCDDNGYTCIDIDDETSSIIVSRSKYELKREDS